MIEQFREALMLKNSLLLFFGFLLTACGGGGGGSVVESYSVIREFDDKAGVGRAASSGGEQTYFIAPDIVDTVYYANADINNQVAPNLNIDDFPLVAQLDGYDFREGFLEGAAVTAVYKTGDPEDADASVLYMLVDDIQLIFTSSEKLSGSPSGTYTFTGLYSAEDREYEFFEVGDITLEANFSNGSFTINATSETTQLEGSGFLNTSSGQISSVDLNFTETDIYSGKASILGGVGGRNATTVSGVWHSNEDTPFYEGAILAHR